MLSISWRNAPGRIVHNLACQVAIGKSRDLAPWLAGQAEPARFESTLPRVLDGAHDLDDSLLRLAAHHQVHLGTLHRLVGHEGQVRAAENGDGASFLGLSGRLPGLVDQGRGAGDAHQVVALPVEEGGQRLVLDFCLEQGHVVIAGGDERPGKVAQAHVDVGS